MGRSVFCGGGVAVLLIAAPILAPNIAQAADAATPPNTVSDVVVTATIDDSGVKTALVGSSVSVLTPDDLDQRGVRLVADGLRDIPGVAVNRSGCIGCLTQVRLRGAEADHVLVLVDGVNIADPVERAVDFSTLLAEDGSRVEVLRGQQSALYGPEAIGGVIQYFAPDGRSSPGIHLRAEYGEFNTVDGIAQYGGVTGPVDYILTIGGYHSDGTPDTRTGDRDLGYWNYTASGKLHWAIGDNVKLTAIVRSSSSRTDINSATDNAGALIDSAPDHTSAHNLVGRLELETTGFGGHWTNSFALDGDKASSESITFGSGFHEEGDRTKGSWISAYSFGDDHLKQKITGAVSYQEERFQQNFDPTQHKLDTTGVVGMYNAALDDKTGLEIAVRNDSNNLFKSFTSYRVEVTHKFDEGIRIHAAAGSGIQYPTQFDLFGFSGLFKANPDLKPEKSEGWEVGIGQTWMDNRLIADVTYFHDRLTDKITSTGFPISQAINLPGTAHQSGIEASLSAKLEHGFAVDLAYTYLDSKDGDPPTQTVRRAPNIASANFNWSSDRDIVRVNLNIRYNGEQRDNAFPPVPPFEAPEVLPAFTLVGLNVDWKLNDQLTVYAHADNLFDKRYEEVWSFVSPGRQVVAGVKTRF